MSVSRRWSVVVLAGAIAWVVGFGQGVSSAAPITTDVQITTANSSAHAQAVIQYVYKSDDVDFASGGPNLSGNVGHLHQSLTPARNTNSRYLVRFDLPVDLSGAVVHSATLKLYTPGSASPGTHSVHLLTSAWTPTANFINWNKRGSNSLNWTNPGGDYVATPTASLTPSPGGSNQFDVTADVQNFADGEAVNNGWIVIGQEVGDYVANSSNYATYAGRTDTAAQIPTLSISYSIPEPGAACVSLIAAGFLLMRGRRSAR